ncbi:MAG TPA: FAD-dependent oxidoreductase [Rubrivivax sp.]|mgnify:CR=1 FL=1|nr:FAD-dependent oxidoreductase [Rubrivivax sp.]
MTGPADDGTHATGNIPSPTGTGQRTAATAAHPPDHAAYEAGTVPITSSGWTTASGALPAHAPLQGDLDAAVAVVGAGLAGSSLALHLAEAGIDVALVEAHQPGWGASGRNAGHVLPTLRDRRVFERFANGGKAFLELFREHHTITFDLARRHGIACDAVQSGYLHATQRRGVFEKLKAAAHYWSTEQGQPVQFLSGDAMRAMTGSRYYTFGVLYRDGGRVNPRC